MARSIFDILDDLNTETSVGNGKVEKHTIPRSQFPTSEQFESPEKLEAWARKSGHMFACLQSGVQKRLIDIRAIFKACPKEKIWSVAFGQENVNSSEWKPVERPKQGGTGKAVNQAMFNACLQTVGTMAQNKMDKGTIRSMLVPIYGDDMVTEVFKTLEKAAN